LSVFGALLNWLSNSYELIIINLLLEMHEIYKIRQLWELDYRLINEIYKIRQLWELDYRLIKSVSIKKILSIHISVIINSICNLSRHSESTITFETKNKDITEITKSLWKQIIFFSLHRESFYSFFVSLLLTWFVKFKTCLFVYSLHRWNWNDKYQIRFDNQINRAT
jgi:hypothetical protein